MNQVEFIEAIKLVVTEESIEAVESLLISPPGRLPKSENIEMFQWFNQLNTDNKMMVMKVARASAEMSVFSFLCVIDGIRAIEDKGPKGKLVLSFEKNGEIILLNDPNDDYLHDLL